jgi:hypothetical protein
MMLDHYQQTKNLLVSYAEKRMGFFYTIHAPLDRPARGAAPTGPGPGGRPILGSDAR